jgi:hypothetical protein
MEFSSRVEKVDDSANCGHPTDDNQLFLHTSAKTPLDGLDIVGWVGIVLGLNATMAIFTVSVARKVINRKALGSCPHDRTFYTQTILASFDSKVAKLTPILTCKRKIRSTM